MAADKKKLDPEKKVTALVRGLDLLRVPFKPHQIGKLARRGHCTKATWDNAQKGNCDVCGGYHSTAHAIHLDYVGHAALTERLLDCDIEWTWEPFSLAQNGLPLYDNSGGLWIWLTVCGVRRPGYGDAGNKTGGNATKETIGDALRNAAMRFGAALDLWHKGDLHIDYDEVEKHQASPQKSQEQMGGQGLSREVSDEWPEGWTGPMERTPLGKAAQEYSRQIKEDCTTLDDINALNNNPMFIALCDQAAIDWPPLINGWPQPDNEKSKPGLLQKIKDKTDEIRRGNLDDEIPF